MIILVGLAGACIAWICFMMILIASREARWNARDAANDTERKAVTAIYIRLHADAVARDDRQQQYEIRRQAMLHGIDLDEALAEALRNGE